MSRARALTGLGSAMLISAPSYKDDVVYYSCHFTPKPRKENIIVIKEHHDTMKFTHNILLFITLVSQILFPFF